MILSRGNFWPKLSKICLEQLVRQRHPAQHAVIPTDAEVKFQKKSQNLVAKNDLLSSDLDTAVKFQLGVKIWWPKLTCSAVISTPWSNSN